MKKGISLLLSFVLIFSLFTPIIQAVDMDDVINEDGVIETSENVIGIIPENVEDLISDIGVDNSIIADIKPFNTFSLRDITSNVVEINVESLDNDFVDVFHFIEESIMISDDMPILNVSEYSEESKEILAPAINAYQDYYNSEEECVVVEVFDDVEVVDNKISFEVDSFSIFAVGDFNYNYYEFYLDGVLVNVEIGVLSEKDLTNNIEFLFSL